MNEWKVILATAAIFGAGVLTGGLLVNYSDLSHLKSLRCASTPAAISNSASNSVAQTSTNATPKSANAGKPRLPEILSKDFVDRLEFELQLTLGQRADIEKIIADGQDEAKKSFQDIRQEAREKIRKQLTPKQLKQFDDLLKQLHAPKKPQPSTNAPIILPTNSAPVVTTNLIVN